MHRRTWKLPKRRNERLLHADTSVKLCYLLDKYPEEFFRKICRARDRWFTAFEEPLEIFGKEFSGMADFGKRFSRFTR
jgi:hypothetical protein